MVNIESLLIQALPYATVYSLAALGEVFLERTGLFNLGLEGMIYLSAGATALVSLHTGSPLYGLLAGLLASIALALIYGFFVLGLRIDQAVTGLSIVFLGIGLGDVIGGVSGGSVVPSLGRTGTVIVEALALIIVPAAMYVMLFRMWIGYVFRSVGENEKTAKALGVPVRLVRLVALLVNGVLVGLAGVFLFFNGPLGARWVSMSLLGWGWMSLGITILGYWHPVGVVAASYLVGVLHTVRPLLEAIGVPGSIADAIPYLVVIAALAVISALYERMHVKPPAAIWSR
jgi:ABC-type uncharacterized transport system permease subunit